MSTLVVGVSASLRDGSHTRKAVVHALDAAERAGAGTDLIDLGDVDLPLYDPDRGDRGDAAELKRRVRRGDAAIVGSPDYHNSYSSAFKNFHDYCGSDEFEDTPVGLIVAAGGSLSSTTVLTHLRMTLRGVGADVIPHQAAVTSASSRFDDDGEFVDDGIAERVADVGRDVVEAARRRPLPAQD